ncbi:MAG TPA: type I glyceraldehyde-3-phosphate dehydrogenase [Thermomicrobiales bacterium]|nr:type I glyceraldehyde-3-phosphate dehydrogenase [Thermomicrobiales bacterium]
MVYRVAINGFGRIGRQVFKAIEQGGFGELFEVVAINEFKPDTAHLLRYDSTYGRFDAEIAENDAGLLVNGRQVHGVRERDPAKLPWAELGIDLVIESTGHFTDAEQAKGHIEAGAKKVIITAPATGEDLTVVLGVNQHSYDPDRHHIISNASCTTNCLAPVAKVVLDNFGIREGLMTTVHAYTSDQRLLDDPHHDLRRARAAGQNIVPTTTGAAQAVALVIPELQGKFDGISLRVPTPTVSLVDFVAITERLTTIEEINCVLKSAAESDALAGILGYSEEPLVSTDYRQDSRSSIVDALSTQVVRENMVKIIAWYDNEWGYSCRVADLAAFVCENGIGAAS